MKRTAFLILFLSFSAGGGLAAQSFSLVTGREPVTSLDGLWRFHTGDNPAWASPNFDDSQWPLLRSDEDWGKQGYLGLKGLAWYRFKVVIPGDSGPLSLLLPPILTNYEVYADGVLAGGCGAMPPHPEGRFCTPGIYALPAETYSGSQTVTIALRVWQQTSWSSYEGGGPYGTSYLGSTPLLRARFESGFDTHILSAMQDYILVLLETLGGLVSLALFLFRRREREYLWFGCTVLLEAAASACNIHKTLHGMEIRAFYGYHNVLVALSEFTTVAFYFRLLRGRRSWLLYAALAGLILGTAADLLFSLPNARDYVRVPVIGAFETLAELPYVAWALTLLLQRARERLADARLLLAPVLLLYFNSLVRSIITASYQFGWQHRIARRAFPVFLRPFPVDSVSLSSFLFLIAMLAILVNRFARTRRDEERYANEIEAARVVQQVLIPEVTPATPGFIIESVYKPYGEVGGDFFQILPRPDGGVLIAIGDVSGKGMPAAMMVSLLVGAFHALAETTSSPAQILAGLNRRVLGRSHGGFTTCLILHANPDGTCTAANAGHIPPYRNGEELACENNLPLGLAAEATYCEFTFQASHDDKLTLLTDGVVEARNHSGELFGFERTATLASRTAEFIAEAAQAFGQEDDITVLTVARVIPAAV